MAITPTTTATTGVAATNTAPTKATGSEAATNAVAGDFQTFLQLLTTQMKNQDPLKPMESTEFVAQLASFSGVEQQVRANDRLDRIIEVLSGGSAEGLAAWVGREVRAPTTAAFAGTPLEVEVTPVKDADRAVLVVRNDFGDVVARKEVAARRDQPDLERRGRRRRHPAARPLRLHGRELPGRNPARDQPGPGLHHRDRGAVRGRRAGAGGGGRRPGGARRGHRHPLSLPPQPGSSSSLAALIIAASAEEPPRSGCTRFISRR